MPVGYIPNPSTMHPVWAGSKRNDAFDALQPLPAVGSYHPEILASNLFGRFGLPYGGVPFMGDLEIPGTGGKTGHDFPGINGPYLLQGDLNGEGGTSATAAAREELLRRFPGHGEPSPEEIADLVVAEWPPDLNKRPLWAQGQQGQGNGQGQGSSGASAQIQALQKQVTDLQTSLALKQSQLETAMREIDIDSNALSSIEQALVGVAIPAKGGGAAINTLRKIAKIVQGV